MNPEQKPGVQAATKPSLEPVTNTISDIVPVLSNPTPQFVAPAVPTPGVEPVVAPFKDKRRHFLAVFFFSFLFGVFGVDRFYLGKIWTGLLKLLTMGGFGIWAMIDLSMVMSGTMRDKQGNEMIDVARYKKFAKRTVWGFTLIILFVVVIVGGISVYFVIQFMNNGGINQLLQGIPGFEGLQLSGQKAPSIQEIKTLINQASH